MFFEKFPIFLSLFAGLIEVVVGIIIGAEPGDIFTRLIITLIVFFVLGAGIKLYLRKTVFAVDEITEQADDAETKEENEEDGNFEEEFALHNEDDIESDRDFFREFGDMDDEVFHQAVQSLQATNANDDDD